MSIHYVHVKLSAIYNINVAHSFSNPLSRETLFSTIPCHFTGCWSACLTLTSCSPHLQISPKKFSLVQTSFTLFLFTFYTLLLTFLPVKQSNPLHPQTVEYYRHKPFIAQVHIQCNGSLKQGIRLQPHCTVHFVCSYLYYHRRYRCLQWKWRQNWLD